MTPNTSRGLWSWEQPLALPAPLGEERRAQGMSEPARMCQPGRAIGVQAVMPSGHRCVPNYSRLFLLMSNN